MLLVAVFGAAVALGLRQLDAAAQADVIHHSGIESDWAVLASYGRYLRRLTVGTPNRPTLLGSDVERRAAELLNSRTSATASHLVNTASIEHSESAAMNKLAEASDKLAEASGKLNEWGSASSESRRGVICVTGQLARVEVESKIENIVKPMKDFGFDVVDLVFVVDSTENHRTNVKRREGHQSFRLRSAEFFKNSTMLLDAVERSAQLSTVRYVEADERSEVDVSMRYVKSLDRNYRVSDMDFALQRAKNHAQQYKQYQGCLDAIEKMAPANGYDIIVRARDDLYVVRPVNVFVMTEMLVPDSIIASKCDQNQGMNDKGAFVHPSAAERYFSRPLANLKSDEFLRKNHIINPEQFLKSSYVDSGLTVLSAGPNVFSWLPEAIDSHSSTCVYSCDWGCYRVHESDLGVRACATSP
jgi:hypothetical protein